MLRKPKAQGEKNHRPYNLKSLIGEGFVQKIEHYIALVSCPRPQAPFLELITEIVVGVQIPQKEKDGP